MPRLPEHTRPMMMLEGVHAVGSDDATPEGAHGKTPISPPPGPATDSEPGTGLKRKALLSEPSSLGMHLRSL
uniref:Uncharacterized protein n=1 Tax=Arundo donax TaxID=35708 RepID=A0A0A9AAL1_ARUDO